MLRYRKRTTQPKFGRELVDRSSSFFNGMVGLWNFEDISNSGPSISRRVENLLWNGVIGDLPGRINLNSITFRDRPFGRGIYFDNTTASYNQVNPATVDPGFFHNAFTERAMLFVVSLELVTGGPLVLYDEGGTGAGFGVGYRTTPQTFVFAVYTGSAGTEIASSVLLPRSDKPYVILAQYVRGTMELWIDGKLHSTGTRGTSIAAHSNGVSLGSASAGSAADLTLNSTGSTEWGGVLTQMTAWNRGLSHEEAMSITLNPWQIFVDRVPFYFDAPAGGSSFQPTWARNSNSLIYQGAN